MGDQTWLEVEVARKDFKAFSEVLGDGYLKFEDAEVSEGILRFEVEEANYGWYVELEKCAEAGIAFKAYHGAGSDYGPGSYIGIDGEFFTVHTNDADEPVVVWTRDGIDRESQRMVEEYYEVLKKLEAYFENCADPGITTA